MSTIDDLNKKRRKSKTQEPQREQPIQKKEPMVAPVEMSTSQKLQKMEQEKPDISFTDRVKMASGFTHPSDEEMKKIRRRENAERIISAIGDGVSSIANLYYTTKGAPSIKYNKSMTEATNARLEKLKADREKRREEYEAAYERATRRDADQKERDRNYNIKVLELEERQKRAQREAEERAKRDAETAEYRRKDLELKERANEGRQKNAEDKIELDRQKEANRQNGSGSASKDNIVFSSGDGDDLVIHKNVWKGNMPQIYKRIEAYAKANDPEIYEKIKKTVLGKDPVKSAIEKEVIVKQYWNRVPEAAKMMRNLTKLSPSNPSVYKPQSVTMPKEVAEDDIMPGSSQMPKKESAEPKKLGFSYMKNK